MHDKEEEKSKLFQLEQAVVKCMRGILMAMMGQRGKVGIIPPYLLCFAMYDTSTKVFSLKKLS